MQGTWAPNREWGADLGTPFLITITAMLSRIQLPIKAAGTFFAATLGMFLTASISTKILFYFYKSAETDYGNEVNGWPDLFIAILVSPLIESAILVYFLHIFPQKNGGQIFSVAAIAAIPLILMHSMMGWWYGAVVAPVFFYQGIVCTKIYSGLSGRARLAIMTTMHSLVNATILIAS